MTAAFFTSRFTLPLPPISETTPALFCSDWYKHKHKSKPAKWSVSFLPRVCFCSKTNQLNSSYYCSVSFHLNNTCTYNYRITAILRTASLAGLFDLRAVRPCRHSAFLPRPQLGFLPAYSNLAIPWPGGRLSQIAVVSGTLGRNMTLALYVMLSLSKSHKVDSTRWGETVCV